MANSMTGYGQGQALGPDLQVTLEIKSVNHRFFEFSVRLPRTYAFLEEKLKAYFQSRIARGKVDVFLTLEETGSDSAVVKVNAPLARAYVNALEQLSRDYGLENDLTAGSLARYPDVLTVQKAQVDEDAVWETVRAAAEAACDGFLAMRAREGAKLAEDVCSRVAAIQELVSYVEARSPETVAAYQQKLEAKMRELLGDTAVDEQRLLTETAIFADKVAVNEETVRLRSHMAQLTELVAKPEPIGRKVDFLVQEMNREANTIGSKCSDVEITRRVVDIKAEIEKIREQIQNME